MIISDFVMSEVLTFYYRQGYYDSPSKYQKVETRTIWQKRKNIEYWDLCQYSGWVSLNPAL